MINVLPLTIESLVAILLLLTILYCIRLNEQLKRLKADGTSMQQTIAELVAATDSAERAIAGLKTTVQEADETLGERIYIHKRFQKDVAEADAAVPVRLCVVRRKCDGACITLLRLLQALELQQRILPEVHIHGVNLRRSVRVIGEVCGDTVGSAKETG